MRPYNLLTLMARSFDDAVKYCGFAQMIARPYGIVLVIAKPHDQAAKS